MANNSPDVAPAADRDLLPGRRRHARHWAAVAGTCVSVAFPCWAQETKASDKPPASAPPQPAGAPDQPADKTGAPPAPPSNGAAELLLFEDVPIVVTGSRSAQPVSLSSIPVSVFTHQDIHYSGLISFPEMLKFLPEMDVLTLDRNRSALGVRGLHFEFSERTLLLIDGRNANDPAHGGVNFGPLPLFPEDVERIEVARGPGGAAWGANAFNGVINVITKRPADTQGLLFSTTINQFGDSFNQVRMGATEGDLAFRVSTGYESHTSSEKAIGDGSSASNDFGRNYLLDTSAEFTFSKDARLKFGVAGSESTLGSFEFVGSRAPENTTNSLVRAFATFERDLDNGQFYARWFGNFQANDQARFWNYSAAQNDLEAQLTTKVGSDHQVTLGGNVRSDMLDIENAPPGTLLSNKRESAWWAGAFLIDRWTATDRLTVESQVRADVYSETHPDWSARLTGLLALDSAKHHIFRLSAAKSFRAPLALARLADGEAGPTPIPGVFGIDIVRADNLHNEEVYALETGYSGRLGQYATVRVDGYYNRYKSLIGIAVLPDPLGLGRSFAQFQNIDGADACGIETELTLGEKRWSVAPWFAINHLTTDQNNQSIRAWSPAEQKAGLRARFELTDDLTLTANYRYTGVTSGTQGNLPYGATNLFDTALTYRMSKNTEVLVGVSDLFNSTTDPVIQASSLTGTTTAGRTLFFRLQLNF